MYFLFGCHNKYVFGLTVSIQPVKNTVIVSSASDMLHVFDSN